MKTLIQLCCCIILFTTACNTSSNGSIKDNPDNPTKSNLIISPNKSHAGEIVYLNQPSSPIKNVKGLSLNIGETVAEILDLNEKGQLAVMTPMAKTGKQEVVLRRGKETIGTTSIIIQEPLTTQLLLQMDVNGKTEVIRKKLVSGSYDTGFANKHFQLSYDIYSQEGNLIFSASIPHPLKERIEVYNSPKEEGLFQSNNIKQTTFPLKIPNVKEAALIKLYESPAQLDLTDVQSRKERKLVSEIKL